MNKKLLILDDDLMFLDALEVSLEDQFELYLYSEPLVALKDIFDIKPDILLVDYKMPKMNGIEFCEGVLKDLKIHKVYLMTDFWDELKISIEGSKVHFLNKPFEVQDFIDENL